MKLFDFLPQNLFSILSSKNKEIYIEALFVLRKTFKQEMTIKKSDLISMIIASLDEKILEMDFSEEEVEENISIYEKNLNNPSAIAHWLLRRLKETGWIEIEYQIDSFDENITLPDYSIKLINILYSFTDSTTREYNSYVHSTYSSLRTAEEERDKFMFTALLTAYENTINLVDELKTLHNNIRRYHQELNDYITVNDILKVHFDEYKNLIMDRVYHPLKTLDSVPRFKTPIIKILSKWLDDQSLREDILEQAMLRGKYNTKEEASEDIIQKIQEIIEIYEAIDNMLTEIDRKNSAYTRASIEKMRYFLNADRSIKGKLVGILTSIANNKSEGNNILKIMEESVNIFKQASLDDKSLYMRISKHNRDETKPMEILTGDSEEHNLDTFIARIKRNYSNKKVMDFIRKFMSDKNTITTADISLPDDEAFILLILASLRGNDKNSFYNIEFSGDYINKNRYRLPYIKFTKKVK
ncbi:MAG TPA: DUF5716 family protein [Candidatus Eremiobacteraeota bacterium]|nr:MAG: hypothetical protein BWY64_01733 [bacterium ADurb.Bin363]HPZ07053.1 DUF5716 family protein [Candidatus Eremiobacteraeota bacterium]